MGCQDRPPAIKACRGKIAIDPLYGRCTQLRNFGEDIANYACRCVIRINQNSKTKSAIRHRSLPPKPPRANFSFSIANCEFTRFFGKVRAKSGPRRAQRHPSRERQGGTSATLAYWRRTV